MTGVIFKIVAIAALPLTAAPNVSPKQCLGGMKNALIAGHFTGPLVCKEGSATFYLAGRTTGGRYSIYDYRYRYLPNKGNTVHGGQKIVIFVGKRYIGQYALSPPPYVSVSVHGTRVFLEIESTGEKAKLDFSKGPPKKVLINGEIETLYR